MYGGLETGVSDVAVNGIWTHSNGRGELVHTHTHKVPWCGGGKIGEWNQGASSPCTAKS